MTSTATQSSESEPGQPLSPPRTLRRGRASTPRSVRMDRAAHTEIPKSIRRRMFGRLVKVNEATGKPEQASEWRDNHQED